MSGKSDDQFKEKAVDLKVDEHPDLAGATTPDIYGPGPVAQTEATLTDPFIGKTIDSKFEILSVIGSGGMSVVYKARHLLMNKTVAFKMMHYHMLCNSKAVRRFQKEAQAISALSHPGLIRIFDCHVSSEGIPYIAMELLDGQPLSKMIEENGPLSQDAALNIFAQSTEALADAHAHGVIHRDLKPNNVMIRVGDAPGAPARVTVVDFGIAKFSTEDGSEQLKMTDTGEVFGTPMYMSPEQCSGKTLDERSDIYSFGCLMYEALTGHTPFSAQTPIELIQRHITDEAPAFEALNPTVAVSNALEQIVLKCLEKRPEDRYQTMADLHNALQALRGDAPASSVLMLSRTKRKRSARLLWFGVLLVAIGGPILFLNWHTIKYYPVQLICIPAGGLAAIWFINGAAQMFEKMRSDSGRLSFVQMVRVAFSAAIGLFLGIATTGYSMADLYHRTQNRMFDQIAELLFKAEIGLLCLFVLSVIVFATITTIRALSKES